MTHCPKITLDYGIEWSFTEGVFGGIEVSGTQIREGTHVHSSCPRGDSKAKYASKTHLVWNINAKDTAKGREVLDDAKALNEAMCV